MRLGVIMTGTGALSAANAGALRALNHRGLNVYAVCGLHGGAWIAAQHVIGYEPSDMEKALALAARAGKRLFCAVHSAHALMNGKSRWLCDGERISRLIKVQTGETLLALCSRRGIFPCRVASTGRRMVFSTCSYAQGRDATLTQQATLGFAARAAMACPPFLSPMPWSGSWLLPEDSLMWAAGQLLCMGADRVLIIHPRPALSREMDAMELAEAGSIWAADDMQMQSAAVMTIRMPPGIGALDWRKMPEIARIGYDSAQTQLDSLLEDLGVMQCRILPFKTRAQRAVSP